MQLTVIKKAVTALFFALLFANTSAHAQVGAELRNKKDGGYKFQLIKSIEATEVQNQNNTGTCWSFSALSFFESELIRMKKGKHNLSEMYIVRNAYMQKAINYVRMHGHLNFGAGGAFHDIPLVIRQFGIVPEEVYQGKAYGGEEHDHSELDEILTAIVKVVVKNPQEKLTPSWKKAYSGALDAYLGQAPTEFKYQGKTYTPQSFAKELGLNMDDYIVLTSFTHHPFYAPFVLEIPDNWALATAYNLPLDEMMSSIDHAIENGFGVAWASDVSEKGFSFQNGLAIVPDGGNISKEGEDNRHFSDAGADKKGTPFDAPCKELNITAQLRQEAFDNYETTDDHGMHITGIAKDQTGTKFYVVKNSWGSDRNDGKGYFYASQAFVKYKTTNVMIHKDALPKDIAKKLGVK